MCFNPRSFAKTYNTFSKYQLIWINTILKTAGTKIHDCYDAKLINFNLDTLLSTKITKIKYLVLLQIIKKEQNTIENNVTMHTNRPSCLQWPYRSHHNGFSYHSI